MSHANTNTVHRLPFADARASLRHVFIRDLELNCLIGVHKHEQRKSQRVRINLDRAVQEETSPLADKRSEVVCYEDVANGIRGMLAQGHVNLVETLAERISDGICSEVPAITKIKVKVCKLAAFDNVLSVGVELEKNF